jgi:uncharacterized membrane protein
MGVPISTLLSIWLLGETIRWRRTLGITLAFAGMVVISFDPRVFAYWEGLALVVASCFFGSLGLIFVKRLQGIRALELQAWIAVAGGSTLMLFSLLLESGQWQAVQSADWRGWGSLAFTVVLSSLIAHTAWYYLVSKYPVTSLSPITLLSPLFGIFFGVTLLDDHLTPRMLLGGAVTLVGDLIGPDYFWLFFGLRLRNAATSAAGASRHSPGLKPCKVHGPTDQRISRKVGQPIAAVMRRTWRLRPSRIVSFSQRVGIALRKRIGGSRGHSHSGGSVRSASAGSVTPSFNVTPRRSCSSAGSLISPSTWTR